MSDVGKLRGLKSELMKADKALDEARIQYSHAQNEEVRLGKSLGAAQKHYNRLRDRIKNLISSHNGVVVSDHAVLRYLERVRGVDVEGVKKQIVTEKVQEYIDSFGSGSFPADEGFQVVVKEGAVITVMTEESTKADRKGRARK